MERDLYHVHCARSHNCRVHTIQSMQTMNLGERKRLSKKGPAPTKKRNPKESEKPNEIDMVKRAFYHFAVYARYRMVRQINNEI